MRLKKKDKIKPRELVYGINPVLELLKAKKRSISTIYTTKEPPKAWDRIAKLLPKHAHVQFATRDILDRVAGTTDHQSVVAWASPVVIRKKFFDPSKQPFLVLLDGIQDPRNLGAILRSSYCTGADGVIITKKKSAPINAVVLKSSAGLSEHLDIYESPSAEAAVQELKANNYNIYLSAFDGQKASQVNFELPLCLVIGSEGKGISKNILSQGTKVTLPQKTSDISYNASVAAGILLFMIAELNKKI